MKRYDFEVWNLFSHATQYLIPRIKALRVQVQTYPSERKNLHNLNEWRLILDSILWSLQKVRDSEGDDERKWPKPEEWPAIQIGLNYMGQYWLSLWD